MLSVWGFHGIQILCSFRRKVLSAENNVLHALLKRQPPNAQVGAGCSVQVSAIPTAAHAMSMRIHAAVVSSNHHTGAFDWCPGSHDCVIYQPYAS